MRAPADAVGAPGPQEGAPGPGWTPETVAGCVFLFSSAIILLSTDSRGGHLFTQDGKAPFPAKCEGTCRPSPRAGPYCEAPHGASLRGGQAPPGADVDHGVRGGGAPRRGPPSRCSGSACPAVARLLAPRARGCPLPSSPLSPVRNGGGGALPLGGRVHEDERGWNLTRAFKLKIDVRSNHDVILPS